MRLLLSNDFCFKKKFFYKREVVDFWDDEEELTIEREVRGREKSKRKKIRREALELERMRDERDDEREIENRNLATMKDRKEPSENESDEEEAPLVTEGIEAKDSRYLWYEGIVNDLNNATRDIGKGEDETTYKEKRRKALDELRKRIMDIDRMVNEYRPQLYWASEGILSDWRTRTPWSSGNLALGFLREKLGIDEDGMDQVLAVKEERASEKIVVKKELMKKGEHTNPRAKLIILGDLVGEVGSDTYKLNEDADGFKESERIEALKGLVKKGFDVRVIGIHLSERESGEVGFVPDLTKLDRNTILSIVKELAVNEKKYQEEELSDSFCAFMSDNLRSYKSEKDLFFREAEDRYGDLVKDLRLVTFLEHQLSSEELSMTDAAMVRLKAKLPKFPTISWKEGEVGDVERQKLRAVYEYLNGGKVSNFAKDIFRTRNEAISYLSGLDGSGESKNRKESVSSGWVESLKEDPVMVELANDAGGKWGVMMARLEALPAEDRAVRLRVLRLLQRIRKDPYLLSVPGNDEVLKLWKKYKSVLPDWLGIQLPNGV